MKRYNKFTVAYGPQIEPISEITTKVPLRDFRGDIVITQHGRFFRIEINGVEYGKE